MRFLPFFLLISSTALAQAPADFRSSAPLTPAGKDALQRFTLPFEVYRDAKPDLADLRVFNSTGEAMPLAFAGEPEATKESRPMVALPIFPLMAAPAGREEPPLDVRVKVVRDGTIVSVTGSSAKPDRAARPVSWLIDMTAVSDPVKTLVIDWNSGPGAEVARVTVEASDDLKSWHNVASRAPLLRVEQGGHEIAQRRVDVNGLKARYLRVRGEPAAFVLKTIEAEPEAIVKPATLRQRATVTARPGTKPGEYLFDAGARLPVESLRLIVGGNSIAPVTISARESESTPPRPVTGATFYKMTREGVELESPAVDIGRQSSRYWVVQLDPRSPPLGAPPSLELQWRPAQVVFVARGEGAFALAFGNPEAKPNALSVTQLIPGYARNAESKLPEAKVGEVQTGERSNELLRSVTSGANPKKIALWVILVLAVVVLGFMAWRLSRQMSAAP
jgi:hypothetical protein